MVRRPYIITCIAHDTQIFHTFLTLKIFLENLIIFENHAKQRKRKVLSQSSISFENESSNSSLQNLRNAVESNIEVKVEDEDDEKVAEDDENVPGEADDSDMEDAQRKSQRKSKRS